jgi:glucose-6-phosphate isomerase, archaeal
MNAAMSELPMVNLSTGELSSHHVRSTVRTLADFAGIYADEPARQSLKPETVVYRVQTLCSVNEGEEGGLLWGTTFIEPGMVGDEYFMTKGHFHANRKRGEYYLTVSGSGALILMDENRKTVTEPMRPGTLHYIPANTAHRVANTGDSVLSFLACWPSDAGHDYEAISRAGFSARLRRINGVPALVEES